MVSRLFQQQTWTNALELICLKRLVSYQLCIDQRISTTELHQNRMTDLSMAALHRITDPFTTALYRPRPKTQNNLFLRDCTTQNNQFLHDYTTQNNWSLHDCTTQNNLQRLSAVVAFTRSRSWPTTTTGLHHIHSSIPASFFSFRHFLASGTTCLHLPSTHISYPRAENNGTNKPLWVCVIDLEEFSGCADTSSLLLV